MVAGTAEGFHGDPRVEGTAESSRLDYEQQAECILEMAGEFFGTSNPTPSSVLPPTSHTS